MKVGPECYICIKRLISKTTSLSTKDTKVLKRSRKEAISILQREYSREIVPAHLSTKILRHLKEVTGCANPFKEIKFKEIEFAKRFRDMAGEPPKNLRSLVEFSAIGNTLDFFKKPESILKKINRFPGFAREDIKIFAEKLYSAKRIVFLADNAGECFFDEPLVNFLNERTEVTYVVKGSPVQNDMTYEDLVYANMADRMGRILSTGDDAVGVDIKTVSNRILEEMDRSDLIIAKGMGNYETLSELPCTERVFHILMAKCRPVALSLQIPLNSYAAILM
ncbi:MAG: damage-control phosphatase ARMT1 family protein [Thermoproteota archaeon]